MPDRRRPTLRAFALLAPTAVLLLCVAGFAVAAGAPSGEIKACAKKKGGSMRLITKGACKKSERTVAWNAQGRAGAPGAAGASSVTVRTTQMAIEYSSCNASFGGAFTCLGAGSGTAVCEPGERATGGGYSKPAERSPIVLESAPAPATGTPTGWTVTARDDGFQSSATPPATQMAIRVVCAAP